MNTKHLTLITTLLFFTALGASAQITPASSTAMNITPGGENTTSYDITLDNNDSYVTVYAENTGRFDVYFSRSYFPSDGSTQVQVEAPDQANTAKNITIVFEGESDNGNSTETFRIERTITAQTINPYETLFEGWINKTQVLKVDGTKYNISQIQSSLYLNANNIKITKDNPKQLGTAQVRLTDTIPGEYANIIVRTQNEETTFSIKNEAVKEDTTCKLFLSTQGGTTLKRGSVFYFQTVKEGTQEAVGAVYVRLENGQTGNLIGDHTTNDYGYGQIPIPETLGSNNSDQKVNVIAKIQKKGSPCKPSQKTLQPNTPYGEYVQNNKKFQLKTSLTSPKMVNDTAPVKVYGNVTGQVKNKLGRTVSSGVILVKKPNGETTDFAFENGEFAYKPPTRGTYQLKATKTNYVDSNWVKFNYADKCPDVDGTIEADGCIEKEMSLRIYTAGKDGTVPVEDDSELRPGTTYILRVYNESDMIAKSFDGKMNVTWSDGTSETIDFENGVKRVSFGSEPGEFSISYDGSGSFKAYREQMEVKKASMIPKLSQTQSILIVVGLFILIGLLYFLTRDEQTSTSSRDVNVDTSSIGGIGGKKKQPNLQNNDIGTSGGD